MQDLNDLVGPERVNDFATPGVINLLCKAGLNPKLATPFLAVG